MKKKLFLVFILKKIILLLIWFFVSHNAQALEVNYVPDELKFYDGNVVLNESEVQKLYPDYQIILISKFDKNRKYVIKNSLFKSKKVLLLNDTKRTFHGFEIYPLSSRQDNNSKSLITIYGKKNIRLKHPGGDKFEIVVR